MRIISSCLVAGLLVGMAAAPAAGAEEAVRLNIGLVDTADAAAVLAALGDKALSHKSITALRAISVQVPASAATGMIESLTADPAHVRYAEVDGVVRANEETISAPIVTSYLPEAWTWTSGSPDVTVAVVDTGVTVNRDLPVSRLTAGYDFVDGDTDASDDDGHGTMAATVIGGTRGNDFGAPGVCGECLIMPVRVLHDNGADPAVGTTADTAAGIAWAADHGARVVNASLSTMTESQLLRDAVEHASAKGAMVVASAGNNSTTARNYPAAYEPALAVSTVSAAYPRNSPTDHWVDVSVNGMARAVNAAGEPTYLAGSSAATAVAAGIVALGFSVKPDASLTEVRKAVEANALPLTADYPAGHAPRITAPGVLTDLGATDTVAPVLTSTGLTEGQLVPARGVLVTPAATDDHAVDRVDYLIDGQVAASVHTIGSGTVLTPPAGFNGALPITVRVSDHGGNTAEHVVTVQVDTAAPVATLLTPTQDGDLVASPADVVVTTTDTDIATMFGQDGATLQQLQGTTRWVGKIKPNAGYLAVVVRDKAGNDTTLQRSVRVDAQGPVIYGFRPEAGAVLGGDFTTTAEGTSDASGVATVELLVNGVPAGSSSTAPYEIPVTGVPSGPVQLTWRLTDKVGNQSTTSRTVTVDRDGPTATSFAPAADARVRGTFTATLNGVRDASGYAAVELFVNGRSYGSDVAAPYSFRVPTTAAYSYAYLTWKLTDSFGHTRVYSQRLIVDNRPPSVSITKAPKNKAKVKGTVKVSVSASDASGIARVELLVNGKVVATDTKAGYVLSVNAKKQKKTIKVQVRAYDKLGNVKYTTTRTWYRK
ncbi:hypothetical protein BJY16_001658 [Actinoplanes octamycinicus]|uniref:Peptidase S8/S53 domain-containing protein n=1 Tax=Actinoplanes octamycinicus TaxID=135948 RepID=A0A7W7M5X4_9ACTN|nr:S8 family serine peptidase [Actinoplanes octamycinicus]MBB4738199.1 hypothetical protein [Actinoplanes octamycinicus]GIE59243.1 hypothetical protein Aoc01nite_46450 [Actinoplanes octamycinicus]